MIDIRSVYGEEYASSDYSVLLINLGSPKSPKVSDVRKYLDEFLMDERIISMAYFWRSLLVRGAIIPLRVKRSAGNYETIWDKEDEVFPLIKNTACICKNLSEQLQVPVAMAMRYAEPSMDDALLGLSKLQTKKVIVLPLYPHYTRSSFETAAVHCLKRNEILGLNLNLKILGAFYAEDSYRKALADSVRPYLEEPFDKLVVSMHGIPLSHLDEACRYNNGHRGHCLNREHQTKHADECYRLQCESTVDFLQSDLGLKDEQIELTYQSRVGLHEWMRPYMVERIEELPQEGVKRVVVVSPCFICDCLETLQEIDMAYREKFLANGGERFTYINCFNDSPIFIDVLTNIITQSLEN